MMEAKLTKIGDEVGLVFDQETMDKLNLTGDCEIELSVVGDALIVQKADIARKKNIEDNPNTK
jgi:antitoxin component of MazEF toxin-antitoxin module